MKPKARLVIPVWGARYIERLNAACLPAVLAPGNLPHLAEHFDCELAIVTQAALFDQVRALSSVQAAQRHCALKLIAMDDVLSHPNYYGLTITRALYRGFTDLGEAAKDTWFLFLNADFILADGSYRALAERMLAGERLIMSPSYCTIEEAVWPMMQRMVASNDGVLSLPPRQMADLILKHRHFSIRSKIINWKMYRIDRVDQFYYMLDNDTMLCKQLPIAVVAFRPERVPPEPIAFWDYGVVSEVCPTSPLCVLGDSDDFLMLELRGQRTMSDQLELGWMDKDAIASDFTVWTTKDQRDCGEFTMALHRKDLPANLAHGKQAIEDYYEDIKSRVAGPPRDYRNHYIWTGMLALHKDWLASRKTAVTPETANKPASPDGGIPAQAHIPGSTTPIWQPLLSLIRHGLMSLFSKQARGEAYRALHDILRRTFRALYGRFPEVRPGHPYWADLNPVIRILKERATLSSRVLSVWSSNVAVIAPSLSLWFKDVQTLKFEEFLDNPACEAIHSAGKFDTCFLELDMSELHKFTAAHKRLRALLNPGGKIIVFHRTQGMARLISRNFGFIAEVLPDCDVAELTFRNGVLRYALQNIWEGALPDATRGRVSGIVRFGIYAMLIAPLTLLSNAFASTQDGSELKRGCTSLLLQVTVI